MQNRIKTTDEQRQTVRTMHATAIRIIREEAARAAEERGADRQQMLKASSDAEYWAVKALVTTLTDFNF